MMKNVTWKAPCDWNNETNVLQQTNTGAEKFCVPAPSTSAFTRQQTIAVASFVRRSDGISDTPPVNHRPLEHCVDPFTTWAKAEKSYAIFLKVICCLPLSKAGSSSLWPTGNWQPQVLKPTDEKQISLGKKKKREKPCSCPSLWEYKIRVCWVERQRCVPGNLTDFLHCHKPNVGNVMSWNWQQGLGKYTFLLCIGFQWVDVVDRGGILYRICSFFCACILYVWVR